jgi:spore maturation protein CgeB
MKIVIFGLSLSSSWGNGHATTYRSLIKGLHEQGHDVTFLEQNVPWYADNRDLTSTPYCELLFYENPGILKYDYDDLMRGADLVVVGSYVPHGVDIGKWVTDHADGVTAFYDIDTPVTLAKLDRGEYEYITPALVAEYDLYLSFSGGKALSRLMDDFHARCAKPLTIILLCGSGPLPPRFAARTMATGVPGHLQRRPTARTKQPTAGCGTPKA